MRSSPDQDESSLVKGEVSVYLENGDENQVWVVLKRKSGDPFEYKKVFNALISHCEINELLLEDEVQNE
jgi:hypothetical protein